MAVSVSASGDEEKGNPEQVGPTDRGVPPRPGAAGREPKAATDGMGSLVTPHPGITEGEWKFLSCGIDSLDIAGYVTWGDNWAEHSKALSSGKALAQSVNRSLFFRDTCCGPLLLSSKGKPPMFRYHLQAKDFHLFLGISQKADNTPNLYASFNSQSIWKWGVSRLAGLLTQLVGELGGSVQQFKPSRVDLCADFMVRGGLPLSLLRDFGVPEDVMTCDIMKGASLETYYIGSPNSSIRARVYDKAKEVLKNHKEWFRDIWQVEKIEDVWRVEFQLRREALKAYGLNAIPDLLKALGGMWADLTGNWYSLRLRDDSNCSRRSVHPSWQLVQACADKFGPVVDLKRQLAPGGNAQADFYTSRAANLLAGYAACVGLPDLTEALESFNAAIAGRWCEEDFFEAYAAKVVQLNLGGQEGGDEDGIPF